MGDFPPNTDSAESPQSLEDLRPIGNVFGAGVEAYEAAAEDAAEAFFRKDFRQALRHYSRMLTLDASQTEGWIGYVLSLLLQGQVDQAGIWALNAGRSLPESPTILALQVLMQFIRKEQPPPEDLLRKVESTDSPDPLFWVLRGWLVLEHKRSEKREHFHRAEDLAGPNNWQVPMLIGVVLEQYGKTGSAAPFYKRAKINFRNRFNVSKQNDSSAARHSVGKEPGIRNHSLKALISRLLHRETP